MFYVILIVLFVIAALFSEIWIGPKPSKMKKQNEVWVLAWSFVLTFIAHVVINLFYYWVPRNGWSFYGTAQGFLDGEFRCDVLSWVLTQFLNPLGFPVLLVIFLVVYVLVSACFIILDKVMRHVLYEKMRGKYEY